MVTHMSVKLRERPVVRKAMRTGVPQRLLPLAFQLCAALLGWLGAGAPLLGGLRPLGLCFAAAVPTPYAVCAAAGAAAGYAFALPLADAVDPALLTEKEEKDLYEAIRTLEPKLEADYKAGRYEDELRSLAPLKAPVDAFFDKVMVNAEDEALRRNRLTLLNELHKAMNQVAKLSCLAS